MIPPHDFEFQLGKYRALKGRGWRGLLALAFLLATSILAVNEGVSIGIVIKQAASSVWRSFIGG